MKQILRLLLIIIVFAVTASSSVANKKEAKKLTYAIDSLDIVLREAQQSTGARFSLIDSLKESSDTTNSRQLIKIGRAYSGVRNDSAIVYFYRASQHAIKGNDPLSEAKALILLAGRLSKATLSNEALDIMTSIDRQTLDPELKKMYFGTLAEINMERYHYHPLTQIAEVCKRESRYAIDSLIKILPEKGIEYKLSMAQLHLLNGDSLLARGELIEVIDSSIYNSGEYEHATRMLSEIYKDKDNSAEEYAYYLALNAISNLQNGNSENKALLELGSELFKTGDLKRAYDYMQAAGREIYDSESRILYASLVPTMSEMIVASQARESEQQSAHLVIYIIALTLIVFITFLLWRSRVAKDIQTKNNRRLSATIAAKDLYITRLLGLCSVYIEGLEDFSRLVDRKLKANQTKDLLEMIESGKILHDQNEKFFEVFDNAVLSIYPDFINELNSLLLAEKRLTLPEKGVLTPEIRIAAFMRMGVNDSGRLSKFLGLSLNTIYTYRNRMKNRAIDRENFEEELINLNHLPL